jgi:hypothetical protein
MLALGNLDFWAAWMLIVACCMLVDQVHMDAPFPSVILGSPFLEIGTQLQGLSCLNLSVHERSKATCVRLPFLQQTTESGFKIEHRRSRSYHDKLPQVPKVGN